MRIDQFKEQNHQKSKQQSPNNFDKKASNPISKTNNCDIYFKSANAISDVNKQLINTKNPISFKGIYNSEEIVTNSLRRIYGTYGIKTKKKSLLQVSQRLFNTSLEAVISDICKPDLKKCLAEYQNIESIKTLYKKTNPEVAKNIDLLESVGDNKAKMDCLYNDFASNHLLTLATADNSKVYTAFWAKNKKIGKKNLVDFWLTSLNIDTKGKNYLEKVKMLNELLAEQKQELIGNTVNYWVTKVLPVQLDKINRNDIKYLQLDKEGRNAVEEIRKGRKKELINIVNREGVEKFEYVQQGDKTLLDFWIDTIDGEGSAKDFSLRQKKDRFFEIINSDDDVNKIYKVTIEEADKTSEQIGKTQKAYSNLIQESELDETSKELLEAYQNNQLFFHIVNGKAKNKSSISNLEVSTKNILNELAKEKNAIKLEARKSIFEPLKDFNYLLEHTDEVIAEAKVPLLMSILKDKIDMSLPQVSSATKQSIYDFSELIESKKMDITPLWKSLKKNVYQVLTGNKDGVTPFHFSSSYATLMPSSYRERLNKSEQNWFNYTKYNSIPQDVRSSIEGFDTQVITDKETMPSDWKKLREKITPLILKNKTDNKQSEIVDAVISDIEKFDKIITKRSGDIASNWGNLVTEAQAHFEKVQINRATDSTIKQIYTAQKALEEALISEIKLTLEDKSLNFVQKDFIARYKDDNNLVNLLKQPANKSSEDINSLIAIEQLNASMFDEISSAFRTNLTPETVNQMPEFADAYIKIFGLDATKLSNQQKYEFLSKIPGEELELASRGVKKYWSENFLSKTVSDSTLDKVRNFDAGYNTAQMSKKLDNISVQLDGQQRTLLEISGNIDYFIDVYKETSAKIYNKLDEISQTMEDIHLDTSNIRNNVKATLYHSIQSTKDVVLREEMKSLLQDADRMELSEFLRTVDSKQKQYQSDHKFETFCKFLKEKVIGPSILVGGAFAIDAFAPGVGTFLASHGAPFIGHMLANNAPVAITSAIHNSSPAVGFVSSLIKPQRFGDGGILA